MKYWIVAVTMIGGIVLWSSWDVFDEELAEGLDSRVSFYEHEDGDKHWTVVGEKWVWADMDYALTVEELLDEEAFREILDASEEELDLSEDELRMAYDSSSPALLKMKFLALAGFYLHKNASVPLFRKKDSWFVVNFKENVLCDSGEMKCVFTNPEGVESQELSNLESRPHWRLFYDRFEGANLLRFCEYVETHGDDPVFEEYERKASEGDVSKTTWPSVEAYCAKLQQTREEIRQKFL